jgi:hypothetical protein
MVIEGLSAGERVVTGGWWKLIDGMMIRPDPL